MAVKIADRTSLPEMLDAMGDRPVPRHAAQPGQGCRMPIDDGDEGAVARQGIEQRLDMAPRSWIAARSLPLRSRPSGIETIRRRYGEHADVPSGFADHASSSDRLIGDRALICDDDCAVWPRLAQPVGPIDRALPKSPDHEPPGR